MTRTGARRRARPGRIARRGASAACAALLALSVTSLVAAASPSPPPGGDPRSVGQGPGLVGDPAFAIVVVVVIGLGALLATLAWLRLTAGSGRPTPPD
jgi:hypothetical protein